MRLGFCLLLLCSTALPAMAQSKVDNAIGVIRKVEGFGVGATEARDALKQLQSAGPAALPKIAAGLKGASTLQSNWLRSAFEANFDAAIKSKQTIPTDELMSFVMDTAGEPRARRMVFEWLSRLDDGLADRLIPGMLLDPSPEFRRDAVARLMTEANAKKKNGDNANALKLYRKALTAAIHQDQVDAIVEPLEALGDKKVDIQKHFGFLPEWNVIGPFDNRDTKGYAIAYPPESEIKLDAAYASEYAKKKVAWKKYSTDDSYGVFDIAKQIENHKGSLMYATTEFLSDADQQLEFRLGTPNAWKLWLNGKLVFEREEYHRSTTMDQYKLTVKLKKGTNRILLKLCQNEQEQEWAQRYQFQLRVCNSTGSGVASSNTASTSLRSTSEGATK